MQTNNPAHFTWKRLLLPATVGILVGVLQKRFLPESNDPATRRIMEMGAVVFICLLGGFSLLKWRDSDLDYYRSTVPPSEEAERRLQQRRRKIGLIGGAFIALGALYLVVLLIRLARQ